MSSITVSNLGKAYKQYPTRWSRLAEWIMPFSKLRHHLKWVLKDINFTVEPGEAVGIIGVNGAGKSTLLKMITGTTQSTIGNIQVKGRVAALLELGMGFHPDFTGRQNALMAGQLLGLTVDEINALMPDIEAFAEIGEYIDQPVRIYSSGMQMRLAFSVATVKRPEILIVDEALSVGDAYFQHKSFNRIREFKKLGTTLLIVSHDRSTVLSICDKAILINQGGILAQGEPEAVIDLYNAIIADRSKQTASQNILDTGRIQTISGTGEASVLEIFLQDKLGQNLHSVSVGEYVNLVIKVKVNHTIPRLVLGFSIRDRLGLPIYGTNSHLLEKPIEDAKEGDFYDFRFAFHLNLGPGAYSIATSLVSTESRHVHNYESKELAYLFEIISPVKTTFAGYAWLDAQLMDIVKL
jgi:lipopolysaccharide transport system ATP-binding protein